LLTIWLIALSPVIIGIVAFLTKEGDGKIAKQQGGMPDYKKEHENYWREYQDQ
jgi:hypothetical protein